MKIFQSSIFRAISAIAIGILLIKYPDNTVTWMTVAIGILFLLSGLISVIVYVNARRNVSEYKITDAEGNVIWRVHSSKIGSLLIRSAELTADNKIIVHDILNDTFIVDPETGMATRKL